MIALAVQAVLVNVAFVLLGFGILVVDPWTARVFIMAVFGEIGALVLWYCLLSSICSPCPVTQF